MHDGNYRIRNEIKWLVLGGRCQGKYDYVCSELKKQGKNIYTLTEGDLQIINTKQPVNVPECLKNCTSERTVVWNHFHETVRTYMNYINEIKHTECNLEDFEEMKNRMLAYMDQIPNLVVISDEIGNGVVPVSYFERTYREETGRLQIEIAKRAGRVERVVCGIGQRIK